MKRLIPRLGFTLGAGYEYAISQHASFQTEYGYTDLGSFDVYTMGPIKVSESVAFHKIASGFNIRF
jgi:outer membrane immunogenic protein